MLLLLPYRERSIVDNVPYVTILLALACLVLTIAYHGSDKLLTQQASTYYQDSGLADIELPRYQAYLAARIDSEAADRLHRLRSAPAGSAVVERLVQSDARFLAELHAQVVVTPDDPAYAKWRDARRHFEQIEQGSGLSRYSLSRASARSLWRFVSYAFLQADYGQLLGNVLVLLLAGPFVEAALGRLRYALAFLAGCALTGGLQILFTDASVTGSSGAVAALAGMLLAVYGLRRVDVFYWLFFLYGVLRLPPAAVLAGWALDVAFQWAWQSSSGTLESGSAALADGGGFVAGVILAWILRPRQLAGGTAASGRAMSEARRGQTGSSLAAEAREAASRLDIRRATRLYRELVELEPARNDYKSAYLNTAMLGADEEALRDAALRLLWSKFRKPTDELRKTFLQLAQDKVLKVLPVDEHLRLARRLVKFREDAAALRVVDALLRDEHMRKNFGRQLADCLLGIFTAYSRHGLQRQAEQISTRLSTYFPTGAQLGGEAPSNRPPPTIVSMFKNTAPGFDLSAPDTENPRAGPPTLPGSAGR
jgi:membrane associated rhomboid family serine protease